MPAPNVMTLDLPVKKGSRLVQPVEVAVAGELVPFPVGTRARMHIRTSVGNTSTVAELTTENGRLVVDESAATVTITMASAFTGAFTFERGVYDLVLIYPDNEEEAVLEGKVFVFPSVTR